MKYLVLLFIALMLLVPGVALADDPFNQACGDLGAAQSELCQNRRPDPSENPVSGTNGIILRVSRILAIAAGVIAVIMIIIGGLRYILSNGDSAAVNSAKNTILYAVIGLVVVVSAQFIISFVINRI